MEKYVLDWFDIIENMHNANTYKLAWGRSILEIAVNDEYQVVDDDAIVKFDQIAQKMLKYYWNQTHFFHLQQGPVSQKPVILQFVDEAIMKYESISGSSFPVWFNYAEEALRKDVRFYQRLIKKISNVLPQNVSFRFLKNGAHSTDLYAISKRDGSNVVVFSLFNMHTLHEYGILLTKVLNYKWAQLLETFNRSPRVAHKVSGSQEQRIRRSNLAKYKALLMKLHEEGQVTDFYTGDILAPNDVTIDHVIPWSFMYSDDIWNMVFTSKSQNSKKSNLIPTADAIDRLKQQNQKLIRLLGNNDETFHQLQEAIRLDLVDKFFTDCRQ